MSQTFPPDIQKFVDRELAAGAYGSQEELVADAIRFFRDSQARADELRREIELRMRGVEGGQVIELKDDDALRSFLAEIAAEVDGERAEKDTRTP